MRQCKKCFKYFGTKRNARKHKRCHQDCTDAIYDCAQLGAKYFCYFDGKAFEKKENLITHLVTEHGNQKMELRAWGFS